MVVLLFSFWLFIREEVPPAKAPANFEEALSEEREAGEEEDAEGEVEEEYFEEVVETPQPKVLIEVTQEDCAEECRAFAEGEKKSYCRSYCGLSASEGQAPGPSGNCEDKKNIERDRCIKDEAVRNQDLSRCDDIYDQGLKKSCQARVTEDYFGN